jgi:hypothetical protein
MRKNRKVEKIFNIILAILAGISIGLTVINPSIYGVLGCILTLGSTVGMFVSNKVLEKADKKLEEDFKKRQMMLDQFDNEFEENLKKIEKILEESSKPALNELTEPYDLIDIKNTLTAYNELYENDGAFDEKVDFNETDESVIDDYTFTISNMLGDDAKIIFTKDAVVDLVCKLRNMNVKEISPAFVFHNDEFYVYKHINKEVSMLAPIKDETMYKIFDSNKKNYDREMLCNLFLEKFGNLDGKEFQK